MSRRNTQDTLSKSPRHSAGRRIRRHRITEWEPEDTDAWAAGGHVIARRNLMWSTATMHVAFSIWSLWSVVVLFLPEPVYGLTPGDKLLLGATATLVGGLVRIPYTLANAALGGRRWATASALVLLIPTGWTLLLTADPGRLLWMYVACAALTGLGGGNYAAALANVDAFYPQRLKGAALGFAGGVGNLGVAAVQLVALLVLSTAAARPACWVCSIYLVALAVVGVGAALRMDDLAQHGTGLDHVRAVVRMADTWSISALYSAAFGSFIGFAFAFVQVLHVNFQSAGQSHDQAALHTAQFAFLGPLLGASGRVVGGRWADRRGGGPVTLIAFAGMAATTAVLVAVSSYDDRATGPVSTGTLTGYIGAFLVLFVLAGVGNGSVMTLIPAVFDERSRALPLAAAQRRLWARAHSGALIGLATAVGALGGVVINLALRQSYLDSGTETPAFWAFLGGYVGGAVLTWRRYVGRSSIQSGTWS